MSTVGNIDAITVGSGPTNILALHASGTGAGSLVALARALGDEFHVHIPNLHGYGDSSVSVQRASPLEQHLLIAEAAMEYFGGLPVHVVGHSMGGVVALMLAATGAENVASLSLAEPVYFGVLDEVLDADAIDADAMSIEGLLATSDGGVDSFIEYWNGTPWSQIPAPTRNMLLEMRDQLSAEAKAVSSNRTPIELYDSITCSVQILVGERTNAVARRICDRIVERRPDWFRAQINSAGHMLTIEQPAAVGEAIAGWIKRNR